MVTAEQTHLTEGIRSGDMEILDIQVDPSTGLAEIKINQKDKGHNRLFFIIVTVAVLLFLVACSSNSGDPTLVAAATELSQTKTEMAISSPTATLTEFPTVQSTEGGDGKKPDPTTTPSPTVTASVTPTDSADTAQEAFGVDFESDEGHSLNRVLLPLTGPNYLSTLNKMNWAFGRYGQDFLDIAPLYELTQLPLSPSEVTHLGIYNPEFNPLDSKNNRLGFSLVQDQQELVQAGQGFITHHFIVSQTEGREGRLDFVGPPYGMAVESPFVAGKGIAKDLLFARVSDINGIENVFTVTHGLVIEALKLTEIPEGTSREELNAIARQITKDIVARHWSDEKRTFDVQAFDEAGVPIILGSYSYPDETCLLQDGPDTKGGDPRRQKLMLLAGVRIRDNGAEASPYGTVQENEHGKWTLWMVLNKVGLLNRSWTTADEAVALVEGNTQFVPVVLETNGVKQIASSYEISPTSGGGQTIEVSLWTCGNVSNVITISSGEAGVDASANSPSGPINTPEGGTSSTPDGSKTPSSTSTPVKMNEATTAPTATEGVPTGKETLVPEPPPTDQVIIPTAVKTPTPQPIPTAGM